VPDLSDHRRNWAGNVDYGTSRVLSPTTTGQLQEVVASSRRARVLGSGHSFNDLVSVAAATTGARNGLGDGAAEPAGVLISLADLPAEVVLDVEAGTARVPAAMTYGDAGAVLQAAGLALPNLASLPQITVAGACATGTHGSGDGNRALASSVRSVELVTAGGELLVLRRGEPDFGCAAMSLGALGVVTTLTLDVEPTYQVRQDVYRDVPFEAAEADGLTALLATAYSVSLFTDLRSPRFTLSWLKHRLGDSPAGSAGEPPRPTWRGGRLARTPAHPVPGQPAAGTTTQGAPGPWNERLPHFRPDLPPSGRGHELQSEYLVPRHQAQQAWAAVRRLAGPIAAVLQVAEVRSVASDDLWLSPAYQQDVVAFHFTWHPDWPAVREVLRALESALAGRAARPHWGKLSVAEPADLRPLFPRLPDAAAAAARLDPGGVFRNDFVSRHLFGE
jgi:alditol oxidase